ncbi:hypothetical protein RIVM261_063260 [Rivularia sp. IAM M-261]|nr:hypothetical protein RIVM261_063260 [Rivularia sp. IAM M-261]
MLILRGQVILQAQNIKESLKAIIQEAKAIDTNLARRLEEINRWVKDVKPGSLMAKQFVLGFLIQIIKDSTTLLKIQTLSSPEEQRQIYDRMTPTEHYWYSVLFPKWINEPDPKFFIWRQKLMAGEFSQEDDDVLKSVSENILRCGGSFWQRYILDLSMATDLIVSNRKNQALCVQITTVSEEFYQEKYEDWVSTLQYWSIERGLFFSYNPRDTSFLEQLVDALLYHSDSLTMGRYLKLP